jgi:rhodanese-related sulfurtransferase
MIRGSHKIPLAELHARRDELDKGRLVITYGVNPDCPAAELAAWLLREEGFAAAAYDAGVESWMAAGLPTEGYARSMHATAIASQPHG